MPSNSATGRPSTANESTQTNGFPELHAGELAQNDVQSHGRWTVESGML